MTTTALASLARAIFVPVFKAVPTTLAKAAVLIGLASPPAAAKTARADLAPIVVKTVVIHGLRPLRSAEPIAPTADLDRTLTVATDDAPGVDEVLLTAPRPMMKPTLRFTADPRVTVAAVRRELLREDDGVRVCYGSALRDDPALRGEVDAVFEIGDDGDVTHVALRAPRAVAKEVGPCVAGTLHAMHFAKPQDGPLEVRVPYLLRPARTGARA